MAATVGWTAHALRPTALAPKPAAGHWRRRRPAPPCSGRAPAPAA